MAILQASLDSNAVPGQCVLPLAEAQHECTPQGGLHAARWRRSEARRSLLGLQAPRPGNPSCAEMPLSRSVRPPRVSDIGCLDAPVPRPLPRRASVYARHGRGPAEIRVAPPRVGVAKVQPAPSMPSRVARRARVWEQLSHDPSKKSRLDAFTTQAAVHEKILKEARKAWSGIRSLLLDYSPVLKGAAQSSNLGIEDRLLRTVSENTLLRYLSQVQGFLSVLNEMGLGALDSLQQFQVLDALLVMHKNGDHVSNSLKAIRWAAKLFQLPLPDLYEGLMKSAEVQVTADRKESVPLPVAFVCYLELLLLRGEGSRQKLLLCGAVLVCCNASLRFSDAQHVQWSTLLPAADCTRAVSYRTKTSKRGMPFGFRNSGFYGSSEKFCKTWVAKYLFLLGEVLREIQDNFGADADPGLFFSWTDQEFSPLGYATVLMGLRALLEEWGLCPVEASVFTLHSMKVCFLSMLSQLGYSVKKRGLQGHHKNPNGSVQLYSRDDVWGALEAQKVLWDRLREGWRPHTPLARGGRHPVPQRDIVPLRVTFAAAAIHPTFPPSVPSNAGDTRLFASLLLRLTVRQTLGPRLLLKLILQ